MLGDPVKFSLTTTLGMRTFGRDHAHTNRLPSKSFFSSSAEYIFSQFDNGANLRT
jgi:hypothetical protein